MQELHHHAQLLLTQHGLDAANDPGTCADLDPLTDLERLFATDVAGCEHLVTTP